MIWVQLQSNRAALSWPIWARLSRDYWCNLRITGSCLGLNCRPTGSTFVVVVVRKPRMYLVDATIILPVRIVHRLGQVRPNLWQRPLPIRRDRENCPQFEYRPSFKNKGHCTQTCSPSCLLIWAQLPKFCELTTSFELPKAGLGWGLTCKIEGFVESYLHSTTPESFMHSKKKEKIWCWWWWHHA